MSQPGLDQPAPSLRDVTGTLVLVGAGKMGTALLEGWLRLGLEPARVAIIEPQPSREVAALAARGLRLNPTMNAVGAPAAIVVAVKPQNAAEIMPFLAQGVGATTVVLSIMAGKTLEFLAEALPDSTAIVRSMPNMPASIGHGITVAVPNARVTGAQRDLAHRLLVATGAVEWVEDEALLDPVTALSGRGRPMCSCSPRARQGRRRGRPSGRPGGAAGARDRRRIGRAPALLAAVAGDAAPERDLAGRHHRRRPRRADDRRRPRSPHARGRRGGDAALTRAGRLDGSHRRGGGGRTARARQGGRGPAARRGAAAENMLSLVDLLAQPDVAYLAPQAPGATWYPVSFLEPIARNEPALSQALAAVGDILARLSEQGLAQDRVALLGFSQGGCLALEYAARNAARFGGIVGLSAGLIGPPGTPRIMPARWPHAGVSRLQRRRLSHPLARVRESSDVLRRLGGDVTERIYPGLGHTINDDEIVQVRRILAALVAANAA